MQDSAESFEALIGSNLRVGSAVDGIVLHLASVDRFPGSGPREEGFSLVFVSDEGTRLEQGTYRFSSDDGEMDIFIVPIQPDAQGRPRYEAVFN